MEVVLADLAFLVASIYAGIKRAWALCLAAGGLFLVYLAEALAGLSGK